MFNKTLVISLVLFVISIVINIFAGILERIVEKKKKQAIEKNSLDNNKENIEN